MDAPGSAPTASRQALGALGVAALALLVFAPAARHAFVAYDDDLYITTAPQLAEGLSAAGLRWAFTSLDGANWFPLTRLSWLLDAQLGGGISPVVFHATNVALHALAAALFFVALARLTGRVGPSAFVAAVFAVHPLHVESVAWAAARKDVLSGVFAALVLLAYERAARRGGALRQAWVALWLACGLMAKPTLVVWPFVLLLLDAWPLRRLFTAERGAFSPELLRARLREKLPLFALALAASAVTAWVQRRGDAVRSLDWLPLGARAANALASLAHYTADAFWPHALSFFYPHPGRAWSAAPVLAGAVLLLGGSALALRLWRRVPAVAVGWLWYVGALVPVIGLVQVGQAARADRYTYLPLLGLALALAWGVEALPLRRARPLFAPLGLAVVVALGVAARAQLATWRDSETLFLHALALDPENHVAHVNLGLVRLREQRLDEASAHLLAALRIAPASAIGSGLLGDVRLAQGRGEEAIRLYRRALQIEPDSLRWRQALARALRARGREDDARAVLEGDAPAGQASRSAR